MKKFLFVIIFLSLTNFFTSQTTLCNESWATPYSIEAIQNAAQVLVSLPQKKLFFKKNVHIGAGTSLNTCKFGIPQANDITFPEKALRVIINKKIWYIWCSSEGIKIALDPKETGSCDLKKPKLILKKESAQNSYSTYQKAIPVLLTILNKMGFDQIAFTQLSSL